MANGIGQAHKLGKQNRKRPVSTTEPSYAYSTTSNHHELLKKKNDITSK